jgi:beta-lactamase superfamily II metal-dependent hydrolase
LPFASLDLGSFSFWLLLLMYAGIAAGIWWANRSTENEETASHFRLPQIGSTTTRLWLGGGGVTALLVWLAILALSDGRLHVAFLDVGQGDAILVTTPDGRQLLINGGPAATELDSAVLHLQFGQISFLLPGGIEAPVEQKLVEREIALRATVLKSPHHGSRTSSSKAFLEAVEPQVVVISVGEDNHFGHPSPEVIERYAAYGLPVLRTDERGTIEFITDGERLWVETAR